MSAPAVFIAGAHTDVGKTYVACALIRAARARGLSTDALKPVASDINPDDWRQSDPGRLLAALGRDLTPRTLEAMAPWRFFAPLAPPMAAKLEGRRLPLEPIADLVRAWLVRSRQALRVVEGVGGVMSPVADQATGLDLMLAAPMPVVLVGGGYLGGISHTLTALEVLRLWGLTVTALVISQGAEAEAPDFTETLALIRSFAGGVPVISVPRGEPEAWANALLDTILART